MNAPTVSRPVKYVRPQRPQANPNEPQLRRDFFVYGLTVGPLAALASTQVAFQIQSDSDFELQKLSMFATFDDDPASGNTESARILPFASIQVTDTGTGRQVFNQEVAIPAIFGDGRIPFILPVTKMFNANASVAVAVTSFDNTNDLTLRFAFIGCKVFRYS